MLHSAYRVATGQKVRQFLGLIKLPIQMFYVTFSIQSCNRSLEVRQFQGLIKLPIQMFYVTFKTLLQHFFICYACSLNSRNWVCTTVSCLYLNTIYAWFNLFTSGIIFMCYTNLQCWSIKTEIRMLYIAGDEPRCEEGEPTSVQVPCQILPRRRCRGTDSGYYPASFLFAGNLILVHPFVFQDSRLLYSLSHMEHL